MRASKQRRVGHRRMVATFFALAPLLFLCRPCHGQSKLLFPDTCDGAYEFRPAAEEDETWIRELFARKSRTFGVPEHDTRSVEVRLRCSPSLRILSIRLLGNAGTYPARATISSERSALILIENPLEAAFHSLLRRLANPIARPDIPVLLERRQFSEFVGIDPDDTKSVERLRRAFFGIAGETQGLLTSILLEELLHSEDKPRHCFSPPQLEERAMLLRLLKGRPFLELSQAVLIGQALRKAPKDSKDYRRLHYYEGWADIVDFVRECMSTPIESVTEAEIRCLAEQYLFDHYPRDAEKILNHPGLAGLGIAKDAPSHPLPADHSPFTIQTGGPNILSSAPMAGPPRPTQPHISDGESAAPTPRIHETQDQIPNSVLGKAQN
jgi:hypothetical protein